MKTKGFRLLLALCMLSLLTVSVFAETIPSKDGWLVRFTTDAKMESNFNTNDYNDPVYGLQPGDDVNFTVTLSNEYDGSADWYMTNEVLHSLEDRSNNSATAGGAYTYILTYVDPSGTERTLYSSDTVGGDDISAAGEGLHEATDALMDYFYLDTLSVGQTATVTLNVALDGETQGNDYQDTLADLQMNFAVELPETPSNPTTPTTSNPPSTTTRVVKTGDETNMIPYFIAMAVSGLLLLALAIYSVTRRKKAEKEGQ